MGVAGALEQQEFTPRAFLGAAGEDLEVLAHDVSGRMMGAFIRATKPAKAAACCGTECCQ
jgi:hypothetical protein